MLAEPAPAPRRTSVRAAGLAVVLVPGLIAAALSLLDLTGRQLGFDEGATVAIVSQHGDALWRAIARDGGNMSGYYLLLHVLVGAFGDGPWVLRLPSVVFAALTPGLVAAIALALWGDLPGDRGRRAAGLAGLLSAVSLPLVYWAQTARGYAAMMCLACAGMLAFLRLVRATALEGRRWVRPAAAYVVLTAAAAYCGFVVLLIVVVQVLALVRRRRALVRFLATLGPLVVVCLPLAVLSLRRGSGQLFWVPRPNHQLDFQVMQSLSSSGLQSTFYRVFTTTPGWIGTAVALIALIALWAGRRAAPADAGRRSALDWSLGLVLAWALVPGLIQFVVSLVAQPVLQPRNLLASVPAVALALAFGLTDRRLPRWLAAIGVALALLIRVVPLAASYAVSPEPWAQASGEVLGAARPGDCIAFYPEDARNDVRWYVTRAAAGSRAPRAVLPDVGWGPTTPYVERYATLSAARVRALASRCRRMWFVSSHVGQVDGPARSRRNRVRWNTLRARLEHVFGHGRVRSVGWASAIHVELMARRR